MPVVVGADADAQLLDLALREEALNLDAPGVGLGSPARHLRLVDRGAPRYHIFVCIGNDIHASKPSEGQEECEWFLGEVGAGQEGPRRSWLRP